MIVKLSDLYIVIQSIYATRQECCKGVNNMIKIRISYTTDEEFKRVLDDLKSFEVVRVRNEKVRGIYKNRWVELRYIG